MTKDYFKELARRRPDLLSAQRQGQPIPNDFEGLVQRMIASEIAAQLNGLPKPADQKALPTRVWALMHSLTKATEKLPAPAPSHVPAAAPTQVPSGKTEMIVLNRDEFGRIARVSCTGPRGETYHGTVTMRDELGRCERATFEKVAA